VLRTIIYSFNKCLQSICFLTYPVVGMSKVFLPLSSEIFWGIICRKQLESYRTFRIHFTFVIAKSLEVDILPHLSFTSLPHVIWPQMSSLHANYPPLRSSWLPYSNCFGLLFFQVLSQHLILLTILSLLKTPTFPDSMVWIWFVPFETHVEVCYCGSIGSWGLVEGVWDLR
jgi:hypothetical protein